MAVHALMTHKHPIFPSGFFKPLQMHCSGWPFLCFEGQRDKLAERLCLLHVSVRYISH